METFLNNEQIQPPKEKFENYRKQLIISSSSKMKPQLNV